MGLVIKHNMMAEAAMRNLGATYKTLGESINALSSGLRINSADDDAAGLAVRELMRADVAALGQGIRNANDGISMLQTFDGASQVIDEKLIRMKELAVQASTGTYNSAQLAIMNSEFGAMRDEITRIAEATDFNGIKGLNNSAGITIHFGTGASSAEDYYTVSAKNMTASALGLLSLSVSSQASAPSPTWKSRGRTSRRPSRRSPTPTWPGRWPSSSATRCWLRRASPCSPRPTASP